MDLQQHEKDNYYEGEIEEYIAYQRCNNMIPDPDDRGQEMPCPGFMVSATYDDYMLGSALGPAIDIRIPNNDMAAYPQGKRNFYTNAGLRRRPDRSAGNVHFCDHCGIEGNLKDVYPRIMRRVVKIDMAPFVPDRCQTEPSRFKGGVLVDDEGYYSVS